MSLYKAIQALNDADARYDTELRHAYGRNAGAARYNPRLNRATACLARLADARADAQHAYTIERERTRALAGRVFSHA